MQKMGISMKLKHVLRPATIRTFLFTLALLVAGSEILASDSENNNLCSSIPLGDAASILSVPIDDLQTSSRDLLISPDDLQKKIYSIHPYNCTISSTSNFLKSIIYATYVFNDPGQARIEFNRMREGYTAVSKVEVVPDTGDETFWAGDSRFQRMVALQGNAVIDVLSPKDFTYQKQILGLVLDRLK